MGTKKITTVQAIKEANVKRTTFYKLVKQYKSTLKKGHHTVEETHQKEAFAIIRKGFQFYKKRNSLLLILGIL
ncbi:hypothetical protein [Priestia megaterium]|uniref:hypothetical protein n=1 Tax=Priestia megaterium TaxID=1404 RepID=UPI0028CB9282|nr:hypothetical protein [Priestia megaterium]